jgi:hypothetical protein
MMTDILVDIPMDITLDMMQDISILGTNSIICPAMLYAGHLSGHGDGHSASTHARTNNRHFCFTI